MYKKFLGKWILFLILLGFSLFMSLKTPYAIFSFFFWIILSILIISFSWLVLVYSCKKLYLERRITLKIEEDDTLEISLSIKNKSFLPVFDVILEDHLGCAQGQERQKFIKPDLLMPKSAIKLTYYCLCPIRGKYKIGPLSAYFFDPLGLFYFKRIYPVYSEVYVYPRTFKIHNFPSLNRGTSPWMGVETSRVSGDDDEFFGVREYKRGDPLKKIHWMASARKNQLIVKEFQRQSFFRATIMFNLEKEDNFGEGKESIEEYTIKIVASIAKYLTNLGVSIEVISHAGEVVHIPFNKGEEHLEEILKFLTVARAESRITLLELFATFQRNILEDSSLIVVMTDRNKAFLPAMLSVGVSNVSLVPVLLKSSSFLKNDFDQQNTQHDSVDISGHLNLKPIYIACKDNLEEKF
ncbi:MAG: DUF58 domain-containing protein [Candidatus Omnitrophota bacterium]|jgi:uncharacterized protein (DUF58 family)